MDTNLPESTIKYLLKDVKQKFYIDCVSVKKQKSWWNVWTKFIS